MQCPQHHIPGRFPQRWLHGTLKCSDLLSHRVLGYLSTLKGSTAMLTILLVCDCGPRAWPGHGLWASCLLLLSERL